MPTILLRFSGLKKRGIVDNRTTLGRWIKTQGFPPGIKIGPNTRAWPEDQVEAWLAARAAATEAADAEAKTAAAGAETEADDAEVRPESPAAEAEAANALAT